MRPRSSSTVGWVRRGGNAVAQSATELDTICARSGAPVTVRPLWLQAWVESYPDFEPLLIGINGSEGSSVGVAPLAVRRRRLVDDVVVCGHGPTDTVTLPVTDADAAARLVDAVAEVLDANDRPWRLLLRHLAHDDPAARQLAEALPHANVSQGDVAPQLLAHTGGELHDYVSASHRRGISRIRNRMVNAGLQPRVAHLTSVDEVEAALPTVERVHRARDADLGRRTALDDPEYAEFFRRVVARHAAAGQLCLTTLELEGRLAAYTLCFVDASAYRMWNCRFDPEWARFSAGKLAMEESVAHALAQGCATYDFMRGAERYKFSYANHLPTTCDVHAASHPVLGLPLTLAAMARPRLRRLREGDGRVARAVQAVDQARNRWAT